MIGAGISGITAGVLLPIKVPGIQLTIFDKNRDVVRTRHPAQNLVKPSLTQRYRAAHGSKISIQVSGATFLLIATSRHIRPTSIGPKNTHKATKSETTGSPWRGSSTSTLSVASAPRSTPHPQRCASPRWYLQRCAHTPCLL